MSSKLCSLCTRLASDSRKETMLVDNVFSPKRMLRYALSYLACYTFGAQADFTTHLIVDTDIFSDVEYVLIATVPLATKSKESAI